MDEGGLSGERPVAGNLVVGGVEVDLGLGGAGEAAVAPADLHVAFHHPVLGGLAVFDRGRPVDLGLAGGRGGDLEGAEAERLAPVPRAAPPDPDEGGGGGAPGERG